MADKQTINETIHHDREFEVHDLFYNEKNQLELARRVADIHAEKTFLPVIYLK